MAKTDPYETTGDKPMAFIILSAFLNQPADDYYPA